MNWISVSFEAGADRVEALTDGLLAAGAVAVDVEDAAAGTDAEQAQYAEGAVAPRPWQRNIVRALIPATLDARAILASACARAGITVPDCRVQSVPERDWVRLTQQQFAPIRISPRLWIVPSWHVPPDPGAVNVVLDPGLAFGTGSHATTRLCLEWLDEVVRGGEAVVDYGCGSGILAIAAMKLGAGRAKGVDIDPQALLAARENALQNRVEIELRSAVAPSHTVADIVVANILAHPLIVLAPVLAGLTARGGRIALSGVLREQKAEVVDAYSRWFALESRASEDGWVLLAGIRQ